MKVILVTLMVSAFVCQEIAGGIVNNLEKDAVDFKNEIEDELTKLTQPILNAAHQLRAKAALYKLKHSQVQLSSIFSEIPIDADACKKLSDTIEDAGEVAWNASMKVYHMVLTVGNTLGDLTGCISINPISAIKCYVNNINTAINSVKSIKPTIVETIKEVEEVSTKLEPEFQDCIGNGPTTIGTTISASIKGTK